MLAVFGSSAIGEELVSAATAANSDGNGAAGLAMNAGGGTILSCDGGTAGAGRMGGGGDTDSLF